MNKNNVTMFCVFFSGICFAAEDKKSPSTFDIGEAVKARVLKVVTTKDEPEMLVPDKKEDLSRPSFADIVKAELWRAVTSKPELERFSIDFGRPLK